MSKINYSSMMERCDELTKNGETLSITWDGGNDSGFFEMKLNGKLIGNDYERNDPIVDFVANTLDYGSFSGDFSTNGEVVYNRETKCFEGTDNYSSTGYNTKQCAIEIRIPKDIWFDRLEFHIAVDEVEVDGETAENTSARFFIINGPRIEAHTDWENRVKEIFNQKIMEEVRNIDDFSNLWEDITIHYHDFTKEGNELVFTIENLGYNFYAYEDKNIKISLTDQIIEDVII